MIHPVHETFSGIINTYSRIPVSLRWPEPGMIRLEDIAHALSNLCRFGGHSKTFYSVAQHSCLVSYLAPRELRLAALLHDATEAYLGDVVKPLKNIIGHSPDTYRISDCSYSLLEDKFEAIIAQRFGIDRSFFAQVKPFDKKALEIEHGYFFLDQITPFSKLFNNEEPCWTPSVAKEVFLSTYNELT